MSLTATNAQVYKGTAAVTYGSGSGVSNRELQGTATITYGGAPTSNTAVSLPGTSGNVMNLGTFFPSRADPSTSNIYVEAWVYLNSATNGFVFTVSDASTEDMGLLLNYASTTQFRVWNTAGSGINSTNNVVLATATWYHVAGSFDRTNNMVYGFVNGVVGTAGVFSGTARARSSSNMTFGAGNSGTFLPLNAYISDFRMVQGGIVPTTSFTPAGAPFRLNTPSYVTGGSTVLSLAEQYFTPSWVSLPGTQGSYLDFGVPSGPYFAPTFSTFIQCWIYINSTAANAGYIIMSTATAEINYTEDWAIRLLSGGTVQFYIQNASIVTGGVTSSSTLSAGRWYHIAVSYAYNVGANGTLYMFVNGALQNSSAMSAGGPRFSPTNRITIGSRLTTLGWSPLNSYIQDLQVVRGGSVPTSTFTPAAAPFGLASPSYVSGGTTVLSLATQYYQTSVSVPVSIDASGGTITYTSGLKIHTFTTVGASTFTVNSGSGPVRILIVAGGGGSGGGQGGAGGGGGVVYYASQSLTPGAYTVTVGNGGAGGANINTGGSNGGNSSITGLTAAVGGGGGGGDAADLNGKAGGSGGGSAAEASSIGTAGAGTAGQGNSGGIATNSAPHYGGGAGGGAGGVGGNGTSTTGGNGGIGVAYSISGTSIYYGGGGGGGTYAGGTAGTGGLGGGGNGAAGSGRGQNGAANTGGGGGAGGEKTNGILSNGGSGIVIISYTTGIQFTSRPILAPVLVNPGTQELGPGQTVTVSQTALQPVNGITWSLTPAGSGLAITSSTDYAATLKASTAIPQTSFALMASNKLNQMAVAQFTGATPPFAGLSNIRAATGIFSVRSLVSTYSMILNIRNGTTSATQDFYADTLGNLTTAAGSGQTLASWLGAATGYVTTWYDQSTVINHATQTNTSLQPTISLDATNKYQVDFSSSSAYMNVPSGTIPMSGAYTVSARHNAINNTGGGLCGAGPNVNNQTNNFRRGGTGYYNYWFNNDVFLGTYAAGNTMTWKFTAETSASAGTTYVYQNKSLVSSGYRSGWAAVNAAGYIGQTAFPETLQGQLYNICFFTTALTDADRTIVENI